MKILHVSDLHFQTETAERYKQDDFFKAIRSSLAGQTIDLCVFSGDLLCRSQGAYRKAFDYFMSQLIYPLKIHKLLLTCGNHDIDRTNVKPMFTSYLNTLKSNDELNRFVTANKSEEFTDNLKHLESYEIVIRESIRPKHLGPLHYIDELIVGSKRIALISLNTAWLAVPSAQAYGGLLFPVSYIYEILKSTKEYDIRILVSHYPLSYLKEFNKIEVEDNLLRNAHCIFSGHTHRLSKSVNYHSSEGLFACVAPSCLSTSDLQHAGYVILNFDLDYHNVGYEEANYADGRFNVGATGDIPLPVSEEKKDAIDLEKRL